MSGIASLAVTVDGNTYYYEAHTMHRVAEILAGTLRVCDSGYKDEFGSPIYQNFIEDFEVLYFAS